MQAARTVLVAATLAIVLAGRAAPAGATGDRLMFPRAHAARCGAPSLAATEGAVRLLRARRTSCPMARRIAVAWDALCRSESEPLCILRTRRTWRCTRGAGAGAGSAVGCRSGRRVASFLWAAARARAARRASRSRWPAPTAGHRPCSFAADDAGTHAPDAPR